MAVGITWSVQGLSCGLDSRRMAVQLSVLRLVSMSPSGQIQIAKTAKHEEQAQARVWECQQKFKYFSRHDTMQRSCVEKGEVTLHLFLTSCHHTKRKSQLRPLLYVGIRVQILTVWDAVRVLDQARIWWGRKKILSPGKQTPVVHPAFNLHSLLLFTPTLVMKEGNL